MNILDSVLALIAPHSCLGCRIDGHLLCRPCGERLVATSERCYHCHKLTPGGRTCKTCRSSSRLYAVRARTYYDGLAKDLVWQLKFERAQAAAREIAPLLMPLLPAEGKNLLITHAPTATSRVRQRGYDQAQLIAKELSRLSGLPYSSCLLRLGQHRQVGSSRAERKAHLAHAFQARNLKRLQNAHVIVIDDILTTGATLESAAATLKAVGAARVEAIVFARA